MVSSHHWQPDSLFDEDELSIKKVVEKLCEASPGGSQDSHRTGYQGVKLTSAGSSVYIGSLPVHVAPDLPKCCTFAEFRKKADKELRDALQAISTSDVQSFEEEVTRHRPFVRLGVTLEASWSSAPRVPLEWFVCTWAHAAAVEDKVQEKLAMAIRLAQYLISLTDGVGCNTLATLSVSMDAHPEHQDLDAVTLTAHFGNLDAKIVRSTLLLHELLECSKHSLRAAKVSELIGEKLLWKIGVDEPARGDFFELVQLSALCLDEMHTLDQELHEHLQRLGIPSLARTQVTDKDIESLGIELYIAAVALLLEKVSQSLSKAPHAVHNETLRMITVVDVPSHSPIGMSSLPVPKSAVEGGRMLAPKQASAIYCWHMQEVWQHRLHEHFGRWRDRYPSQEDLHRFREVFKKIDTNHNGHITKQDLAAFKEKVGRGEASQPSRAVSELLNMCLQHWEAIDEDKDDSLTVQEIHDFFKRQHEQKDQHWKHLGKALDGSMTPERCTGMVLLDREVKCDRARANMLEKHTGFEQRVDMRRRIHGWYVQGKFQQSYEGWKTHCRKVAEMEASQADLAKQDEELLLKLEDCDDMMSVKFLWMPTNTPVAKAYDTLMPQLMLLGLAKLLEVWAGMFPIKRILSDDGGRHGLCVTSEELSQSGLIAQEHYVMLPEGTPRMRRNLCFSCQGWKQLLKSREAKMQKPQRRRLPSVSSSQSYDVAGQRGFAMEREMPGHGRASVESSASLHRSLSMGQHDLRRGTDFAVVGAGVDQSAQVNPSLDADRLQSRGCGRDSIESREMHRSASMAGGEPSWGLPRAPARNSIMSRDGLSGTFVDDHRSVASDAQERGDPNVRRPRRAPVRQSIMSREGTFGDDSFVSDTQERGHTLLTARGRSENNMAAPSQDMPGHPSDDEKKARWRIKDRLSLANRSIEVHDEFHQQGVTMRPYPTEIAKERMVLYGDHVAAHGLAPGGCDGAVVAAIQALAVWNPDLVRRMVVPAREAGHYKLLLYTPEDNFERQHEVDIDDSVPCLADPAGNWRPYYARAMKGELWGILLEKGIAKVLGGVYSVLQRIEAPVVWAVLLGQVSSKVFFRQRQEDPERWGFGEYTDVVNHPCAYEYKPFVQMDLKMVWQDLVQAVNRKRLVVCSIEKREADALADPRPRFLALFDFLDTARGQQVKICSPDGIDGYKTVSWDTLVIKEGVKEILFCDPPSSLEDQSTGPFLGLANLRDLPLADATATFGMLSRSASQPVIAAQSVSGSSQHSHASSRSRIGRGSTPPPPYIAAPALACSREGRNSQLHHAQIGKPIAGDHLQLGSSSSRSTPDRWGRPPSSYRSVEPSEQASSARPHVPPLKFPSAWQDRGHQVIDVVTQPNPPPPLQVADARPKTWLSSSPLLVKQTLNALPPRERGPDLWHNLVVLDPDDVQKDLSSKRDGISESFFEWRGGVRWVSCSRVGKLMEYHEQKVLADDLEAHTYHDEWQRLCLHTKGAPSSLLGGKGSHAGIMQAVPATSWLVAAITSLAGSSVVEDVFQKSGGQALVTEDGPYHLVLYRPGQHELSKEVVPMNDRIPCFPRFDNNRDRSAGWGPCFTTAFFGEMWPYLLEKGVAHLIGGYSELMNPTRSPPLAWAILTGRKDFGVFFQWKSPEASTGARWGLGRLDVTEDGENYVYEPREKNNSFEASMIFEDLLGKAAAGKALACTFQGAPLPAGHEEDAYEGLPPNQAYSILSVKKIVTQGVWRQGRQQKHTHELVELYAPVRDIETRWRGPWSEQSEEWRTQAGVREELGAAPQFYSTGRFWMSFSDFQQHVKEIYFSVDGFPRTRAASPGAALFPAQGLNDWALQSRTPPPLLPPVPPLVIQQPWLPSLPAGTNMQASAGYGYSSYCSEASNPFGLEDVASSLGRALEQRQDNLSYSPQDPRLPLGTWQAGHGGLLWGNLGEQAREPRIGRPPEDLTMISERPEESDASSAQGLGRTRAYRQASPGKSRVRGTTASSSGASSASSGVRTDRSDAPARYKAVIRVRVRDYSDGVDGPWKAFRKWMKDVLAVRGLMLLGEQEASDGSWHVTFEVNGRQYIQAVETGKHLLIGHPTLQCLEMRRSDELLSDRDPQAEPRLRGLRDLAQSVAPRHRGAQLDARALAVFKEVNPKIRAHIDLQDPYGRLIQQESRTQFEHLLKEAVVAHVRGICPSIEESSVEVGKSLGNTGSTYGRGTVFTAHFEIDGKKLPGVSLQEMRRLQDCMWTFGSVASTGSGTRHDAEPRLFRDYKLDDKHCSVHSGIAESSSLCRTGHEMLIGTRLGSRLYICVDVDAGGGANIKWKQFQDDKVKEQARRVSDACGGPAMLTDTVVKGPREELHFEVFIEGNSVRELSYALSRVKHSLPHAKAAFGICCCGARSSQSSSSSSAAWVCAHLDVTDVTPSSDWQNKAAYDLEEVLKQLEHLLGTPIQVADVTVRRRANQHRPETDMYLEARRQDHSGPVALTIDFKIKVSAESKAERQAALQKIFNLLVSPEIHRERREQRLQFYERFKVDGAVQTCAVGLCESANASMPRSLISPKHIIIVRTTVSDIPGIKDHSNACALPRLFSDAVCVITCVPPSQVSILHIQDCPRQPEAPQRRIICFEIRIPESDQNKKDQELHRVLRACWGLHREAIRTQWQMLPFFQRFSVASAPYVDCQPSLASTPPAAWHLCRTAEVRAGLDVVEHLRHGHGRPESVQPAVISEWLVEALQVALGIPPHRITVTSIRSRKNMMPAAKDLVAIDQASRQAERNASAENSAYSGHDGAPFKEGIDERWCHSIAFEVAPEQPPGSEEQSAQQIARKTAEICQQLRQLHSDAVHRDYHNLPFFTNLLLDAGPVIERSPCENVTDVITVAPQHPEIAIALLPSSDVKVHLLRGRVEVVRRAQCDGRSFREELPVALAKQFREAMVEWLRENGFPAGVHQSDEKYIVDVVGVREKTAQRFGVRQAPSRHVNYSGDGGQLEDAYSIDFEVQCRGRPDELEKVAQDLENSIQCFTALSFSRTARSQYGHFFEFFRNFTFDRGVRIDHAGPQVDERTGHVFALETRSVIPAKLQAKIVLRKGDMSRRAPGMSGNELFIRGIAGVLGVAEGQVQEVQVEIGPDNTVNVSFAVRSSSHKPAVTELSALRSRIAAIDTGSELQAVWSSESFPGYTVQNAKEMQSLPESGKLQYSYEASETSCVETPECMAGEVRKSGVHRRPSERSAHKVSSMHPALADMTTRELLFRTSFLVQFPCRDSEGAVPQLLDQVVLRFGQTDDIPGQSTNHAPYDRNRLIWALFYFLQQHVAGHQFKYWELLEGCPTAEVVTGACMGLRELCMLENENENYQWKEMQPHLPQIRLPSQKEGVPDDPEVLVAAAQPVTIVFLDAHARPERGGGPPSYGSYLTGHSSSSKVTIGHSASSSSWSIEPSEGSRAWVRIRCQSGKYGKYLAQVDGNSELATTDSSGPETLWMFTRPPPKAQDGDRGNEVVIMSRAGWLLTRISEQAVRLERRLLEGQQRWWLANTMNPSQMVVECMDPSYRVFMKDNYRPRDVCQYLGGHWILLDIAYRLLEACTSRSEDVANRPDVVNSLLSRCIDVLAAFIAVVEDAERPLRRSEQMSQVTQVALTIARMLRACATKANQRLMRDGTEDVNLDDFFLHVEALKVVVDILRLPPSHDREVLKLMEETAVALHEMAAHWTLMDERSQQLLFEAASEFLQGMQQTGLRAVQNWRWPHPEDLDGVFSCLAQVATATSSSSAQHGHHRRSRE